MKEAVVLWKSLRGEVNARLRCQHILMEGIAGHPRNPSRQLADIVLLSAHIPRSPRHWRPPCLCPERQPTRDRKRRSHRLQCEEDQRR